MKSEILSLRKAAAVAGVSHELVRQWCLRHGIGTLLDGRWRISRPGLDRVARNYRKARRALKRVA